MYAHVFTIDGFHYIVEGVNLDLFRLIESDPIALKAFDDRGKLDLVKALSSNAPNRSFLAAEELITRLWSDYPELGPLPFLKTLGRFQYDRNYYPGYRDHMKHQLKVYVLGLLIYSNVETVRMAVNSEIRNDGFDTHHFEQEFLLRWLATSLFHDIGYVLENNISDDYSETWKGIKDHINDILEYPLHYILPGILTEADERQLIKSGKYQYSEAEGVNSYDNLETHKGKCLLEDIDDIAQRTKLGTKTKDATLLRYYRLAKGSTPLQLEGKPDLKRGSFRDHGITSSLVLMKTWENCRKRLSETCKLAGKSAFPLYHARETLIHLLHKMDDCSKAIKAAAAAMALHNINVKQWTDNDLASPQYSLSTYFTMELGAPVYSPQTSTPLAFLLKFADELQDWGRDRYTKPSSTNINSILHDQQFRIKFSEEKTKLFIWFYDDRGIPNPLSRQNTTCSRTLKRMTSILKEDDVKNIIDTWDTTQIEGDGTPAQWEYKVDVLHISEYQKTRMKCLFRILDNLKGIAESNKAGNDCMGNKIEQPTCLLQGDSYKLADIIEKCDRELTKTFAIVNPLQKIDHQAALIVDENGSDPMRPSFAANCSIITTEYNNHLCNLDSSALKSRVREEKQINVANIMEYLTKLSKIEMYPSSTEMDETRRQALTIAAAIHSNFEGVIDSILSKASSDLLALCDLMSER